MTDPKVFYNSLDSILAKIGKEQSGENFFSIILAELDQTFSASLHIESIHVYEQRGNDYVQVLSTAGKKDIKIVKKLPLKSEAVKQVLANRSYIYDDPRWFADFHPKDDGYIIPAAIHVYSAERHWLLIFELGNGWVREEMTLFLNALRTALNYRLLSVMIERELELAVQIQNSLLPKDTPQLKEFDIYGFSRPAEMVGGDCFEYFQYDDETFGVAVGDASGHGLSAALLVRDVIIGLRMGIAKEMRIVHTLRKLNQVIQRSTFSTNFVSLFVGEFENDGHFFYVNAGHPPPFLVDGDSVADLGATGITLGFLPDINLYRAYVHMNPGSVLTLYTDGLLERRKGEEDRFNIERLKALVIANQHLSSKEIVELVFKNADDFADRTSWEDDATMVVIKRLE
jgi:sigma-B regulation protein RsbU (phosphoserine phosphatase)